MSIPKYKKPVFWVSIAVVALCIIVAVCFMTNREENNIPEGSTDLEEAVSQALLKDYRRRFFPANECDGVGYVIFGSDESGDIVKVYGWMQYSQFGFEDDRFVARDGSSSAFVMTLQRDEQEILTMKKVEYPIDGEPNRDSLKKSFPQ